MLWHAVVFDPIYNLLIFILNHVRDGDVGIAIIVITIVIKVILFPLSLRVAKTQYEVRLLEPEIAGLKEKHNGDREKIAKETMAIYKREGTNPFSSFFLTLIQVPILLALYFSVSRGGGVPFPDINVALLYSFVPVPDTVNMVFLGLVDIAAKSWPLALLAGLAQFFQTHLSLPPLPNKEKTDTNAAPSFKDDFARSMQIQMRYVMPLIIAYFAYAFSATVALYLFLSALAGIGQELIVRRHVAKYEHNGTGKKV